MTDNTDLMIPGPDGQLSVRTRNLGTSGGNVADHFKRPPHHGGQHHLAKGADVRQAGRAVAGLEDDAATAIRLGAGEELSGFLEGPRAGLCRILAGDLGEVLDIGHGQPSQLKHQAPTA